MPTWVWSRIITDPKLTNHFQIKKIRLDHASISLLVYLIFTINCNHYQLYYMHILNYAHGACNICMFFPSGQLRVWRSCKKIYQMCLIKKGFQGKTRSWTFCCLGAFKAVNERADVITDACVVETHSEVSTVTEKHPDGHRMADRKSHDLCSGSPSSWCCYLQECVHGWCAKFTSVEERERRAGVITRETCTSVL